MSQLRTSYIPSTVKINESEYSDRLDLEQRLSSAILYELQRIFDRIRPKSEADFKWLPARIATLFPSLTPILSEGIERSVNLAYSVAESELPDGYLRRLDVSKLVERHQQIRAPLVVSWMMQNTTSEIRKQVSIFNADPQPVSNFIDTIYPQFSRNRAKIVGVTETTNAFNRGGLTPIYTLVPQITHYQWLSANDHRVCPICSAMAGVEWSEQTGEAISMPEEHQLAYGQVRPVGQKFVHPGGGGAQARYKGTEYESPEAHPGCRCRIVAWIS